MRIFTALLSGGLVFSGIASLPVRSLAEGAAADGVYAEPLPQSWVAPAYPPDALKAGAEGKLVVEFVVDATGRVQEPKVRENKRKPVDPRLAEAALAAARQWTFSPALNAGRPEPRALLVSVGFYLRGAGGKPSVDLPREPDTAPTKPARVTFQPDPPYPDELMPRKLPGTAAFDLQVTAEGKAADITVLYASDAAFVEPGLATLRRYEFEPGRQGPLAVVSAKKAEMEFTVAGDETRAEDILAANGISGFTASPTERPPVPRTQFAPVYPRELLVAGETGEADVEFVIGENGLTDFVHVMSASRPEFGAALAAAVAEWCFQPAIKDGMRSAVTVRVKHAFTLKDTDAGARLVTALKTGGISGAGGLDRSLRPLWRVAPHYPAELMAEKPAGEAVIEFIIDREGRCRLPRVVSATREAFGWAAATAISQWVFVPPTRHGEAVDVRVSIPIAFAAPTN